ncbi:unnamed protein product, partial [Scytosiphon promiscuus]
ASVGLAAQASLMEVSCGSRQSSSMLGFRFLGCLFSRDGFVTMRKKSLKKNTPGVSGTSLGCRATTTLGFCGVRTSSSRGDVFCPLLDVRVHARTGKAGRPH